MNVQRSLGIKDYLQQKDVQERIQERLQDALSNVTVSISRAAGLFGFSESQLREWEKKGLLESDRTALSQDGKGHRQYTTNELSKLAVFQELIKKGGYSPGEIHTDLDAIGKHIKRERQNHVPAQSDLAVPTKPITNLASQKPIDQRVKFAAQEVFWRYFTSQVLRLSLMLICEDIPETLAGLILPFGAGARLISNSNDLSTLSEVLVGWQDKNGSFDTFLDSAPFFEHPSDFRIEPLVAVGEENQSHDLTMIVIQREASPLDLSQPLVQTVRRLLTQVYDNASQWKSAFNDGKRDYLYQATDFSNNAHPSDKVLDTLMEMVIQLGGKSAEQPEQDRWKFCCLLLPQDNSLPAQQRSLLVQAQSTNSPYKLGISVESTKGPLELSLRAYQSGNIIYEPDILFRKAPIVYSEQEKSTRSAIALPIIREDGLSIAVLYLASNKAHAFPVEDHRVLRLIGTMIEELLLTYQARQQVTGKRTDFLDQPDIVDPAFKDFLTENDFIRDLESLLSYIQSSDNSTFKDEDAVSFIAVDIDDQSTLAAKYGDRVTRNLSQKVGMHLSSHLKLFSNVKHQRIYHINADRYYLLLEGMSLDEARKQAEQIRVALNGKGSYLIDAQHLSSTRSKLPATMLELQDITVRLGIPSYKFKKLKEVLKRYDSNTAVFEVRTLITGALDLVLDNGSLEGGNVIISWDHDKWGYVKWTPS